MDFEKFDVEEYKKEVRKNVEKFRNETSAEILRSNINKLKEQGFTTVMERCYADFSYLDDNYTTGTCVAIFKKRCDNAEREMRLYVCGDVVIDIFILENFIDNLAKITSKEDCEYIEKCIIYTACNEANGNDIYEALSTKNVTADTIINTIPLLKDYSDVVIKALDENCFGTITESYSFDDLTLSYYLAIGDFRSNNDLYIGYVMDDDSVVLNDDSVEAHEIPVAIEYAQAYLNEYEEYAERYKKGEIEAFE